MAQKGDVCFDLAQCFYEKYGNPGQFSPIKNCVYVYSRTIYFEVGMNSKMNTNYTALI